MQVASAGVVVATAVAVMGVAPATPAGAGRARNPAATRTALGEGRLRTPAAKNAAAALTVEKATTGIAASVTTIGRTNRRVARPRARCTAATAALAAC